MIVRVLHERRDVVGELSPRASKLTTGDGSGREHERPHAGSNRVVIASPSLEEASVALVSETSTDGRLTSRTGSIHHGAAVLLRGEVDRDRTVDEVTDELERRVVNWVRVPPPAHRTSKLTCEATAGIGGFGDIELKKS